MGMIHIFERGGDDAKRFDEAMKRAKSGLMEACEIWEDMKAQFSQRYGERDSYDERYAHSPNGYDYRYTPRDAESGMYDRRGRDSMGRYR